jgi:carbon monoxide dehydrogenase subunit G
LLKLIGLFILLAVVFILVAASTKPSDFRVERSIIIDAPPAKVATLINDFHNWPTWSPWAKMDPAMKTTYSGPATGPGSMYEWAGNSKVGQGRMQILTVEPAKTSIKIDFLKPFEGHNTADFLLQPEGTGTRVTWVMYGPTTFPGKIMSVFTTMDKMIGPDFVNGLANLKSAAEHS